MSLQNDQIRPAAVALAAPSDGRGAAAAMSAPVIPVPDPRIAHARPHIGRFLALSAELGLLLLVFSLFNLEKAGFGRLLAVICGAFLVHYWLPFRFKEPFWVAVSIAGAFWQLDARSALLLIAAGGVFFLIFRSDIATRLRIAAAALVFAVLACCQFWKAASIPAAFYPVFGAVFMFRIIIYAYDMAHQREPAALLPFLSYFFILPNYYFTLFPVIDYQTMRRTYYQRDIHAIAQQGVRWMTCGAIQLALYRVCFYLNDRYLPDRVTTFGALCSTLVLTYLLYLNVSGRFHLVVGLLHLFGYDLPETNRRYLLASSLTDYWRRVNIYWKDFMVKIVYFPVFFKLRKRGTPHAQMLATMAVFVATWGLHAYQSFWILGQFTFRWPDTIFWTVLGGLVIVTVTYESRHSRRRTVDSSWRGRGMKAVQVIATFSLMTVLWSLWSAPSVNAWLYLMTHWSQTR